MSIKNILCFSPHPDDEILGCGGSLIKAIAMGCNVYICYLSMGENGSPIDSPRKLTRIRKREVISLINFLKIPEKNIYFLNIPDNEIDQHDLKNFKKIIKIVRTIKPDLVYLPHELEKSLDHSEANKLVVRALDMSGSNNFNECGKNTWWVENVLAYEVWTPLSSYQYSEDVSDFMEKKIKALNFYKSQSIISGNISDFIGEKARFLPGWRASMTLGSYRESFQVIRMGGILNYKSIK